MISPLPENVEDTLRQTIQNSDFTFDFFSAKAKVRIESDEIKGAGRMNIRMKKDSIIWFNFKKVSIEGARGIITPKNYTFLYRTEKKYETGDLNDLADHFNVPLNYSLWQEYLGGEIPQANLDSITLTINNEEYKIESMWDSNLIEYNFNSSLQLIGYRLTDSQNRTLAVELEDLDSRLGIYKKRKLNYFNNEKVVAKLELELSDIEINVRKKMPFSIPNHYERL